MRERSVFDNARANFHLTELRELTEQYVDLAQQISTIQKDIAHWSSPYEEGDVIIGWNHSTPKKEAVVIDVLFDEDAPHYALKVCPYNQQGERSKVFRYIPANFPIQFVRREKDEQ